MISGDERDHMSRWRSAEGRIYPLIMSDPDLYQLAVGLIVEVRDVLRAQCASVSALVDADAATTLSRCPSAAGAREQGLDAAVAFDAACAQRFRELSGMPGGHLEDTEPTERMGGSTQ